MDDLTEQFIPNSGELMTLETADGKNHHVEFFQQENNQWLFKILPTQAKQLCSGEDAHINFVRKQRFYRGVCTIERVEPVFGLCHTLIPCKFEDRPLRRLPRHITDITTAVMFVVNVDEQRSKQLSEKTKNRIFDLNIHGALLASKEKLNEHSNQILLATSFDKSIDLDNDHFFYRANIVREISNKSTAGYPYTYGLEFLSMTDKHKNAMTTHLSSVSNRESAYKSA